MVTRDVYKVLGDSQIASVDEMITGRLTLPKPFMVPTVESQAVER